MVLGGWVPSSSIRAMRAQTPQAYQRVPVGLPPQQSGGFRPQPAPAPGQAPPQQAPSQQGPTVVVVDRGTAVIEPELVPPDALVAPEGRDPPLSPIGRAAVGAAVGGLITAAFELPGGPLTGILAGGVLGYYVPPLLSRRSRV